jgi:PPOX class probable F420-dependent enzyme
MSVTPDLLNDNARAFLAATRLATLTTHRRNGSAHVVPVGFMYDPDEGIARIIAPHNSVKVRNIEHDPRVVLCEVEGGLWATLEGTAVIRTDAESFERTVREYTAKFGPMHGPVEGRCAIEVTVKRVMGRFSIGGPR